MKKIILMGCLVSLLAGCGGGSDSGNTDSVQNTPQAASYTPTAPKAGDTYVYQDTVTYSPSSANPNIVTNNITRKVIQGNLAQGLTVADYYGQHSTLGFDLAETNTNTTSDFGCSYSEPYNALPIPWSIGQTSNQNVTETCGYGTTTFQESIQVIDYETITTKAGAFNTYKVQITKSSSGAFSSDPSFPAQSFFPAYNESETCWYDVVSGFAAKCTGSYDYSASLGSSTALVLLALQGISNKFDFTTELVNINPVPSLTLTANTTGMSGTNSSLKLTTNQIGNLTTSSGNYIIQASQPVNWTVAASDGSSVLTDDNAAQFTFTSGGKSFVSAPIAGQQNSLPTNYIVTATLLADPSQSISVNVTDMQN